MTFPGASVMEWTVRCGEWVSEEFKGRLGLRLASMCVQKLIVAAICERHSSLVCSGMLRDRGYVEWRKDMFVHTGFA